MAIASLADLTPDPRNARRHNPANVGLIEDALREVGAARSIVIDENGTILAGNATVQAATAAGLDRIQIVDTDGDTLVAVRRSGLTDAQKTRLALFDNRAAELADWDSDELAALQEADAKVVAGLWTDDEFASLFAPGADDWGAALGDLPTGDKAPFQQMTFTLSDEQAEQVKVAMDRARGMGPFIDTGNENGNGNALARICETFLSA